MSDYVEKGKSNLPLLFFLPLFDLFFLLEDGSYIFFPYGGLFLNNDVTSHKTHHSNSLENLKYNSLRFFLFF